MGLTFNNVTLAGNLTRDPEPGVTKNGTSTSKFGLAVNEYIKDGERANFFDCEAYGSVADRINRWLSKGSGVLIGGKLQQQRWQNSEGQNRQKVVVIVQLLQFTSGKGEGGGGGGDKNDNGTYAAGPPADERGLAPQAKAADDDIPF